MGRKGSRARTVKMVDQRIGPALMAARVRAGQSRDDIAGRCGVTCDQIARIEQGRREVSFPLLLRLADELDLDPRYFTSYQETSLQIERNLRHALRQIDMPAEAVAALTKLSVEAQGALVDGLRWLSLAGDGRPFRQNDVVRQILDHGVVASLDYILADIAEFGVDADDLWRLAAQLEELPGERRIMADRLMTVTTVNGGQIDPVTAYQPNLRPESRSRDVMRVWAKTIGSAVNESVRQDVSRTIYPLESICRYIDSGQWGCDVIDDRDLVQRHVRALVETLHTTPNYHIGFIDEAIPFSLLVKGDQQALLYTPRRPDRYRRAPHGVALRYSRADVTRRFRDYFDEIWERIPTANKDSRVIAGWLEQRIMARR